jgi:3-oxoadipate enol-lactonase
MPMIDADGCLLNVSVEGRDGGPTLMLSNSLGCTLQMWEPQMKPLTQLFRVIRYDRRGHGKSGVPPGPTSMERYGRDVLAILDDLNIDKVHWCGLSMGGMVGQWLGANAPERIEKLILSNTNFNYADKAPWNDRIKLIKEKGLASLVDPNMERWFTKGFRERAPQAIAKIKAEFLATDPIGYVACCEAIRDMDFTASNPTITVPTMVIVGSQDPATPPAAGEAIAKQIKGAKLVALEAAHIANIEQPKIYAETVINFLQ